MSNYRAGIIGAGGIAGLGILGMHDEEDIGEKKFTASHAGGYDATDGIELAAVADVDEEKLDRFGEAWDVPEEGRYVGHEAMLEAEDLDVVSVCTPSYLHHDPVVDAARSAADPSAIWCEKPIASSVSDANEMVEVCDETDTELVVNHSFRFTEKQRRLAELVREEDLLGEVHSVSMQFRMELLRNSTHLLDTLVQLLDARAERVAGHITGENEAVDSLEAGESVDDAGGGGFVVMDDGSFATVDCTIPRADSSMTMQFVGSEGEALPEQRRRRVALLAPRRRRPRRGRPRRVRDRGRLDVGGRLRARLPERRPPHPGRPRRGGGGEPLARRRGDALAGDHRRLLPLALHRRAGLHPAGPPATGRRDHLVVSRRPDRSSAVDRR